MQLKFLSGWGLYTSCEFGAKIQNLLERELETTRQLLKTMLEQKKGD